MSFTLFVGPLTNVFRPSAPSAVRAEHIVLDFALAIANTVTPPGTAASIEWYFEFVETDPNAAGALWAREVAEEDLGTGDVRMAEVVRRFAASGAETGLAPGSYRFNTQFKRVHAFYRFQIRTAVGSADTCTAMVRDPFGVQLISAP
jgi:hypothetical protein